MAPSHVPLSLLSRNCSHFTLVDTYTQIGAMTCPRLWIINDGRMRTQTFWLSISAFPGSPLEMGYNSKFLARRTSPHLVFTFFRAHLQPLTPHTPCPHSTDCFTAVTLISSISTFFPALAHGVPPCHLAITKLKYHLFSEIPSCHPLPWWRAWSEPPFYGVQGHHLHVQCEHPCSLQWFLPLYSHVTSSIFLLEHEKTLCSNWLFISLSPSQRHWAPHPSSVA